MADMLVKIISGFTIVFAFLSLYFSFRLYQRYSKYSNGWAFILGAITLVFIPRVAIFIIDADLAPEDNTYLKFLGLGLYFLIMVGVVAGLWKLTQMFNKHELVEKEILAQMRKLNGGGKARKK